MWLDAEQKNVVKTHSVALPRVTGFKSAVQNWSEAMAAFHMEYSLAIGQ